MEDLIIWNLNLWKVVMTAKRDQIDEWMIEHRTLAWNVRTQYMFKKYEYTFECLSSVAILTDLIAELWTNPIKTVKYNKTWWNTINPGISCYVKIDDETYEWYESQPVNWNENNIQVEYTLIIKEI